jgi:hypothetical protein
MFGTESRKERSTRLGVNITLWDDIKVGFMLFNRWVYNTLFPTRMILVGMFYKMIDHFGTPEKALKYMKDSDIVKVSRGWNKITLWAKRPGIFIGPAGREINYLEDKLGKKIIVKEVTKMNSIEKAYEHMEFVVSYHDEY